MTLATYLDDILSSHRTNAARDARSIDVLIDSALAAAPVRGFRNALVEACAGGQLGVIAEIKRRSPSKGVLAPALDPSRLARCYEAGGASAVSVLTDGEYFGGSVQDLTEARTSCSQPVLRKDFTVSPRDVCDARIMGADCVLLIAAALDDFELGDFLSLARQIGLDALVEIHDERELERAVAVDADLMGVNQRDLVTFDVDTARAVRMASLMPQGVVRIAESGIQGPADATKLAAAGYHGVLVGEALVRSADPAAAVAALRRSSS